MNAAVMSGRNCKKSVWRNSDWTDVISMLLLKFFEKDEKMFSFAFYLDNFEHVILMQYDLSEMSKEKKLITVYKYSLCAEPLQMLRQMLRETFH